MSIFIYRMLKNATWGIHITFDLEEKASIKDDKYVTISNELSIDLSMLIYLTEAQKWYIIKAFESISHYIPKDSLVIKLNKIVYNPVDYQDEGLFCGIVEWAAKQYNFTIPEFDIVFDKKHNRYNFSNIPLFNNR